VCSDESQPVDHAMLVDDREQDVSAHQSGSSSSKVPPVGTVGGLGSRTRLMISYAFPNINASSFGIPYTTLTEYSPVHIKLPYSGSVANDCGRHDETRSR